MTTEYRFGEYTLLGHRLTSHREGETHALTAREAQLLTAIVDSWPQRVTNAELLAGEHGRRFPSVTSIGAVLFDLRKCFLEPNEVIERTRVGMTLVAPLTVCRSTLTSDSSRIIELEKRVAELERVLRTPVILFQ